MPALPFSYPLPLACLFVSTFPQPFLSLFIAPFSSILPLRTTTMSPPIPFQVTPFSTFPVPLNLFLPTLSTFLSSSLPSPFLPLMNLQWCETKFKTSIGRQSAFKVTSIFILFGKTEQALPVDAYRTILLGHNNEKKRGRTAEKIRIWRTTAQFHCWLCVLRHITFPHFMKISAQCFDKCSLF